VINIQVCAMAVYDSHVISCKQHETPSYMFSNPADQVMLHVFKSIKVIMLKGYISFIRL